MRELIMLAIFLILGLFCIGLNYLTSHSPNVSGNHSPHVSGSHLQFMTEKATML